MGNLFMKMWNKDPGMACVIALLTGVISGVIVEGTLVTVKDVMAHK